MDASDEGPPVVALPERVDRRLRLGPFPSARDALKFVGYAAVGAVFAPLSSPYVWLPFLALGAAVAFVRRDGAPLDESALRYAAWRWRTRRPGGIVTRRGSTSGPRRTVVPLPGGRHVAVVRCAGVPTAFLPPDELSERFERFRGLLRSDARPFLLLVAAEPVSAGPVRPPPATPTGSDRGARAGYGELVGLLCRRRLARRVYLALATDATGPDGVARLEGRVRGITEQLAALGVRPARLDGPALANAVVRFGWNLPSGGPE